MIKVLLVWLSIFGVGVPITMLFSVQIAAWLASMWLIISIGIVLLIAGVLSGYCLMIIVWGGLLDEN